MPLVPTQNKFQVLTNLEDGGSATASTSSQQNEADMDISDPPDTIVNGEQVQNVPNAPNVPRTKKGPRPPSSDCHWTQQPVRNEQGAEKHY